MEWRVNNALNRDVERQHLNKILKEIRQAIDALSDLESVPTMSTASPVTRSLGGYVGGGASSNYNPSTGELEITPQSYTLTLDGDVSGSAKVNGGPVTISTILDPSLIGVPEAPVDNQFYWRRNEDWSPVPEAILSIADLQEQGLMALVEDPVTYALEWTPREIEGTTDEIDVADGDGIAGNPVVALSNLADTGVGTALVKITRDSKGRVEGTEAATTDDLSEGTDNLYFSETRAQDAVGSILQDTTDIELVYDDTTPSITANIINPLLVGLAGLSPSDGDILEYNGTSAEWAVTKDPRLLYLDGGNF